MIADIKNNPKYFERDPKKKDTNWANEMISMFRNDWRHVVDQKRSKLGMEILMGKQSMEAVLNMFRDNSDWKKINQENIVAIPIWERIRNIIIAEYKKGTYKPEIKAIDSAAEKQRTEDKDLLRTRPMFESLMTDLHKRAGNPPYRMPQDKFNGNVDEFDSMGLNPSDEMDIGFFFSLWHKLDYEISAQEIVWALLEYNQFDDHIEDMVNDVLAKKSLWFQTYTAPSTGEIKHRYTNPDHIKAIKGERRDFKDAMCVGYDNKQVNVARFLELAGPEFNFEQHRQMLLLALCASNSNTNWADLTYQGILDPEGTCVVSWANVLRYTVNVGYMEFKSIDGQATKVHKKNKLFYNIDYSTVVSPNSSYYKDTKEYEVTYKAWFLSTGYNMQFVFQFGPLYHQLTYGAYNEYSCYSLIGIVMPGPTAVEVSKPYIDIANKTFWKMVWGIDESMPRKRVFNYESMIQLAKKMAPSGANAPAGMQPNTLPGAKEAEQMSIGAVQRVEDLMKMMIGNLYELYTIPKIDGQAIGGNQRLNYWDEGGIDPIVEGMRIATDWAEQKVSERIGLNAIREAETPDPKDGFKLNVEALKQSRNATYYINDGLNFMLEQSAISLLMRAQDGIEFKGTNIYQFLLDLVGEDAIDDIRALDKIPMHKFGIFPNVFNSEEKRAEFMDEAKLALQREEVTYDQFVAVKEIIDYKKAGKTLAFFRLRTEKKKQQDLALAHQRALQLENVRLQGEVQLANVKGGWAVKEKTEWGSWYMAAHQKAADSAIIKKQMDEDNNEKKMQEHADSVIKVESAKEDLKYQQPIESGATTPAGQ